jgi:HD-GYP domain-containing protein (c-di-GMP phosphodiesterase class II)
LKINVNEILYAVSNGLDAVEAELLGHISIGHSKRLAVLSIITAKGAGLSAKDLIDIAAFSILHDNALTEVNQEEHQYRKYNGGKGYAETDFNIRRCIIGENNAKLIPFRTNCRDVIMLHHENADGSGPFGRSANNTPIKAQIIHLADCVDHNFDLNDISKANYLNIVAYVKANTDTLFSKEVSTAFVKSFKHKHLNALSFGNIDTTIRKATKSFSDEYSITEILNLATLFAKIIDYKSFYSCVHSLGVAQKAIHMADYYKYPTEKGVRFYLAGALHDVGKLMIKNEILQKPSRLTDAEYEQMRNHAFYTHEILSKLKGFDDIVLWASHHHEKLNGGGYPFGLDASQLSSEERLMTCCDIYQALTEARPYKDGFTHAKAMEIMRDMVIKGEIDMDIVNDMNYEMTLNRKVDRSSPTSILYSSEDVYVKTDETNHVIN